MTPHSFSRLTRVITQLRWGMPLTLALIGVGYPLWEGLAVDGYSFFTPQILIGVFLLGILGPFAIFLTLTWAMRVMQSLERAEREREHQHQQLVVLNAIAESVNRSLELDSVLECALDRVLELLHLESGEVRLLENGKLILRTARGVSEQFKSSESEIPVGQCYCGKSAQTGELIAVEDLAHLPDWGNTACVCEKFNSLLAVPVRTSDRVVGVIHVGSRSKHPFNTEDRALLMAIGQQIGAAVEKARLHSQVKSLNRELENRVNERTAELVAAKEELAHKADALHQVLREERRVEERTRARIAHDLHDGVQQLIIGAMFETQAARDALQSNPDAVPAQLGETQDLLRRIESEMRSAIYSLRPVALDTYGLVPAVRELIHSLNRISHLQCELHIEGTSRRFDPESEVAVYRIVQEALNNVEAHANARHATVNVRWGRELTVEVSDDGTGFDIPEITRQPRTHLGLMGMEERADSIGGKVWVWSQMGSGTLVTLRVPLGR
jgi:signal transduction histidine kinase